MNKILLLVDCQNDFIDGALRNDDAIKAVPNIINKINEGKYKTIIFTRDTHDSTYLETAEGKNLPVEHCIFGTKGWEINHEIYEAANNMRIASLKNPIQEHIGVYTIDKPTFGSVDLIRKINTLLFFNHPEIFNDYEIEVCGFCTDICVISNVLLLKANFYENVNITVDASCCAGVTPEKHNAALDVMESCQIKIINK